MGLFVAVRFANVPGVARRCSPVWLLFWKVESVNVAPGRDERTPWIECSRMTLLIDALVAVASRTTPYQVPGVVPEVARKRTGEAALPVALKSPRTVTSTRAVSAPATIPSVALNCTIVPAWMFRKAPRGTVMSPWMV